MGLERWCDGNANARSMLRLSETQHYDKLAAANLVFEVCKTGLDDQCCGAVGNLGLTSWLAASSSYNVTMKNVKTWEAKSQTQQTRLAALLSRGTPLFSTGGQWLGIVHTFRSSIQYPSSP